ncbi:hypothetical protein IEQ34_013255 [Dendrobium chrysotoxum]|uniref:Uncharacterized protein n=1 Tax=Dendrobium chrysotoxum TaxID=161865 RepID=A0AAV7GR28_DENCH|nr:hypothetical protein IEQ34_013255 [Dendrobium chrysotoxum]
MVGKQLQKLVGDLKSKLKKPLKSKKPYDKMDKTESMRVEIKSRKARKLISEMLKIADSPAGHRSYAF